MVNLSYYVEIATPTGVKIAQVDDYLKLEYARVVNGIGTLKLTLQPDADLSLYRLDGRLGVWRYIPGGYYLDTETVWFIRSWKRVLTAGGVRTMEVTAYSASELLGTRVVAYAAESAQASKSDNADDMMKAVVRENLGASAVADRDLSAYLTVQADLTQHSSIDKAFARRNVLTVLQEIAASATQQGEPLFFDIVVPVTGGLEFRTYYGQRGLDKTLSSPVPTVLSPERGSILSGELEDNYSDEITTVYAAGQGEKASRSVSVVEDVGRMTASPFNRREYLQDCRQESNSAKLADEGSKTLQENRPWRVFSGQMIDTAQMRYGLEWSWGDKLTVEFEGLIFDCYVNAVKVTVADSKETITAALRSEELL